MSGQSTGLTCEACAGPLDQKDDANKLYELATGDTKYAHKHINPIIDDDGNSICAGTPSLCRYLTLEKRPVPNDANWDKVLADTIPMARMMMG